VQGNLGFLQENFIRELRKGSGVRGNLGFLQENSVRELRNTSNEREGASGGTVGSPDKIELLFSYLFQDN